MRYLMIAVVMLLVCSAGANAAVLVQMPNGTTVTKTSLAVAATAADTAGKTVLVTTPQTLTNNIAWPADRELKFEKGGYIISGSYALTGLKEARPEYFGVNTTPGTTDMKTAIEKAAASTKRLVMTGIYNANGAVITTVGLTITGGGTIKNSSIVLGAGSGSPVEMFVTVDGITFSYDALGSGHGIEMQRCRNFIIRNCQFTNCNAAIYKRMVDVSQQINRGIVTANNFYNCNYAVFNNTSGFTPATGFMVGDMTFTDNISYCRTTHLHIPYQDGLVCKGNTFFFPGYTAADATKERHIYSQKSNFFVIAGNNFFESGLESIYLNECGVTTITGNNIVWSGQRVQSYAINIVRTAAATTQQNILIANNNITGASGGGIDLGSGNHASSIINYATVADNQIHSIGTDMSTQYYGTALSGPYYYITVTATSNRITYRGNRCFSTTGTGVGAIVYPTVSSSFLNSYADNVAQVSGGSGMIRDLRSNRQLISTATDVELDATGYDTVAWSPSAPATLRSIKAANVGDELVIYAGNGNLTLDHQSGTGPTAGYSLLILKGAADVTLTTGQLVKLRYLNTTGTARWFEVSRNF